MHHCSELERSMVKDQVERQVVEMMMQDEDKEAHKRAHGDMAIDDSDDDVVEHLAKRQQCVDKNQGALSFMVLYQATFGSYSQYRGEDQARSAVLCEQIRECRIRSTGMVEIQCQPIPMPRPFG